MKPMRGQKLTLNHGDDSSSPKAAQIIPVVDEKSNDATKLESA